MSPISPCSKRTYLLEALLDELEGDAGKIPRDAPRNDTPSGPLTMAYHGYVGLPTVRCVRWNLRKHMDLYNLYMCIYIYTIYNIDLYTLLTYT